MIDVFIGTGAIGATDTWLAPMAPASSFPSGNQLNGIVCADLNKDGKDDVVVVDGNGGSNDNNVTVYINLTP